MKRGGFQRVGSESHLSPAPLEVGVSLRGSCDGMSLHGYKNKRAENTYNLDDSNSPLLIRVLIFLISVSMSFLTLDGILKKQNNN